MFSLVSLGGINHVLPSFIGALPGVTVGINYVLPSFTGGINHVLPGVTVWYMHWCHCWDNLISI